MNLDKPTIAEQLHRSFHTIQAVEDLIMDLFEEYEPDIYNKPDFDFEISSDAYDNSIEIHFELSLPYPYEPCKQIRQKIYDLGFSVVYWNFPKDRTGSTYDEIRGYEPRHYRDSSTWKSTKHGYVDERFDEDDWKKMVKL